MKLWENEKEERLIYYPAANKKSDASVVIFPGGAYAFLADHEGKGYAEFLNGLGYDAFVCAYRVAPDRFPLPLLDARRAMRLVRANAEKLGLDAHKVFVMGSSAGGNLAALLCTYTGALKGEDADGIDRLPYLPDGQILCYPVISLSKEDVTDFGSRTNLLGEQIALKDTLSPEENVTAHTPPAFLWHTANDPSVHVENTLVYASALSAAGVPFEVHIFPEGFHGLGLAKDDPYVGAWTGLLARWLEKRSGGAK